MNQPVTHTAAYTTHNTRTSTPSQEFEPAIPAIKRLQTYVLGSMASRTGCSQVTASHYTARGLKSPPLVAILSHLERVHTLPSYFSKIHFNIILPSTPLPSKWLIPSGSSTKALRYMALSFNPTSSIILLIRRKKYKLRSSSLCNFLVILVTPSPQLHVLKHPQSMFST
jgi:hypothetical protein